MNASAPVGGGRFLPDGNPGFVRAMVFMWMALALGIIAFGAVGGPYVFEDPASWPRSAAERAEAVDEMRRLLCGLGGFLFLLFGGLGIVVWRIGASARKTIPAGAAAPDPYAWMCHVAGLTGGRWIGPVAGRAFAVQSIRRRGAASTFHLSTPVACATRVSWSRRPPAGQALDALAGRVTEDGARHGVAQLAVSAADPTWAARLFASGSVRAAVAALTGEDEIVLIVLRPKRLLFSLPYGSARPIDVARLQRWVAALAEIARAAESNGAPNALLEPNVGERLVDGMLA